MQLVSIIIPAFNQGRFLRQAVTSAVNQSYEAVEVIVVDDGSTDETAELCRELKQLARVRVIEQSNEGVGAARNRGAREAAGEYLCFLDADDFYHPDKVVRQAAVLDRRPDVDWVYCDIVPVDRTGRPADDLYSVADSRSRLNGDIFEELVVGGFFPPHAVMVRRRVFDAAGGFDPLLGGHADLDLWLRLAARGRMVEFVDERLAFYRTHGDGMSRDLEGMRATRMATLTKLARAFPERIAAAVSRLQDTHEDLHRGNQWLNEALGRVMAERPDPVAVCSLVEEVASGRAVGAEPERVAIWDVSIDGSLERAVVLHPPSTLSVHVPASGPCTVSGAVALHPDIWERAESGPCQFQLTMDDRVRWSCLLDPRERSEDRQWVPFTVDAPWPSADGHEIRLETQGIGGHEFRWALWRLNAFTPRAAVASSELLEPETAAK